MPSYHPEYYELCNTVRNYKHLPTRYNADYITHCIPISVEHVRVGSYILYGINDMIFRVVKVNKKSVKVEPHEITGSNDMWSLKGKGKDAQWLWNMKTLSEIQISHKATYYNPPL